MKTSFWTKLLDLISPRLCVVCGTRLSAEQSVLCSRCWLHMPFTHFSAHPASNPMARLFWGQFPIERATALFFYEPKSEQAELIYSLKYRNRPEVGVQLGSNMARDLLPTGFFQGIDALVPVPISRNHRRQRGYNQSEAIAQGIAQQTGLPIYNKVLVRKDGAVSQTRLSQFERHANAESSFCLADASQTAHRHLLIVDDVVTTGSTMSACGRLLSQAPGVRLSALSLGFTKT